MSLALDSSIMRFLISTPSRLVGQLDTPDLYLQIVFPTRRPDLKTWTTAGPHSRSYYLLSINAPDDPSAPESFAVPATTLSNETTVYALGAVGEMLTDLASVWFGKRFDYHGAIARDSIAQLPILGSISPVSHYNLAPFNHQPRSDLSIDLNVLALKPILCFLYKRQPEEELSAFWAATRFYARALRTFENDPEVAFFNFIVALEIIASQIDVPYDDLYDEQARKDLRLVEQGMGRKLANRVRQRYFQLSRRVVYTAKSLVNETFFAHSQAEPECCRLSRDNLETCVKAAYTLRSKYAHRGVPFGIWLRHAAIPTAEIQIGRPVLPDSQKSYEETLSRIPTFTGLERLVRFVIMRFAHLRIESIHDDLD